MIRRKYGAASPGHQTDRGRQDDDRDPEPPLGEQMERQPGAHPTDRQDHQGDVHGPCRRPAERDQLGDALAVALTADPDRARTSRRRAPRRTPARPRGAGATTTARPWRGTIPDEAAVSRVRAAGSGRSARHRPSGRSRRPRTSGRRPLRVSMRRRVSGFPSSASAIRGPERQHVRPHRRELLVRYLHQIDAALAEQLHQAHRNQREIDDREIHIQR